MPETSSQLPLSLSEPDKPTRIEARGGPEGDYFDKLAWIREHQGHIQQIITKYPGEYVIVVGWYNPTPKTDDVPQP